MSDAAALTVPPAGWYPDRNDATSIRWWDGQQWTDHTKSIAPEAAVEQPVSVAAFGFVPPEQNPVAPVAPVASHDVAPGWYPDNADRSMQRWWDGTQWTAHTAPAAPTALLPQPTPDSYLGASTTPVAPYGSAQRVASVNNTMATLAMIFSLVSFVGLIFAPLLLLALAGIIVGIVALRRIPMFAPGAGRRGQAIAGIVVGAVSLIATILLTVAAISVYQQVHQTVGSQASTQQSGAAPTETAWWNEDHAGTGVPYTLPVIEQNSAEDFVRHYGVAVSKFDCDADASVLPGDFFECVVTMADQRTARIQIAMSDGADGGYNILILDPPAGGDGSTSTPPAGDPSDPDLSNS